MQFIPILPIKYLKFTTGHYALSLAHLYRDKRYARFFQKLHNIGHYVILDNAAYEQPVPMSMDALWELVEYYGASELVLPDVLRDTFATGFPGSKRIKDSATLSKKGHDCASRR
jgi:hypothetical protein